MDFFAKVLIGALGACLVCRSLSAGDGEPGDGGSEVSGHQQFERSFAKRPSCTVIDTNTVMRLGYELPDRVVLGADGRKKIYAKGILAQCALGAPKHFELKPGGAMLLGSAGFLFDSNYACARTNAVVFAGGGIANFEPSFIKSAAPVELSGRVSLIARHRLLLRTSFAGDGTLVKTGRETLGLQYPCPAATGVLSVEEGALVMGPAASWGGTVRLAKGTVLTCPSLACIGRLEKAPGARVVETGTARHGDLSDGVFPQPATAYDHARLQRERMGRGVFAFRAAENRVRVGWRYKSTDPTNIAFNVYRDGAKVNGAPIRDVTCYDDDFAWTGLKPHVYEVRGLRPDGREIAYKTSAVWTLPAKAPIGYYDLELTPPASGKTPEGGEYAYFPCDTSIGDIDGDGEYELVVIWWPTLAMDNSHWGQSGETWLEGVKLDGTNRSLWKICLGPNIRSGSHYVPVMVADFDGDGAAEIICRTADGTRDGKGRIQNAGVFAKGNPFKDWRLEDCHVIFAPNYVTVFSGKTGEALDTRPYRPPVHPDPKVIAEKDWRAINRFWGARAPGNQAFRFLAAVAFLDGVHPSAVMCRGYYSRTYLAAYDWDGKDLTERWFFSSDDEAHGGYAGQGFHNLRVGDVDFDGRDEILYGHMCVDHDGKGLWTTGYGHGDALHLIQASPETRGLQLWTCHEGAPFGVSLIDAQSGRTLLRRNGPQDTGSCNALDVDPDAPGVELFSGTHCGIFSAKTYQEYMCPKPRPQINYYGMLRFGIWWMGDMTRSAYAGGDTIYGYTTRGRVVITQWQGTGEATSNHGTKGAPCLIADLFGDWREELLLRRNDNRAIRIYMTPEPTPYRFHTFLEDPVYRTSITTQNCGYNVPPGPGFYFGPDLKGHRIWFRGTFLE
ncbi:MAG: rhamnogalacturonan lyase [Kiritimatiellia bacterium]